MPLRWPAAKFAHPVRDPSVFTAPEDVQVVQGDFDDDASIANALKGVTVMLLAGRDSPNSVSQHRRVLAQVRRAGVHHVVKLSAIGASPGTASSVDARALRSR